ncbi:hypothetical protein CARUB_v10028348mg [Capsella rubella]|uniref:F-box domain-containing protein n=1 Tax=Capsella rubella TaxID=81985 RepID=R0GE87_9BRAS|nr:hypothetical protein CARUB_v10028348mg [Capsella rubella]
MERSTKRLISKDRLSQLPDPLLCRILNHLPTKEVVRTSVLSTTWRSLWLWVPSFELNSQKFQDFDAFVSFGDRYFDYGRVSCIDKVKLTIEEPDYGVDDPSYFTTWFDVLVKSKIRHLDVKSRLDLGYHKIPLTFYTCETLVYLKLTLVRFDDVEFVSLPCLKTMHLKYFLYPNEATFERLVSSCPVLEELKIDECFNHHTKFCRVLSKSLIRLIIRKRYSLQEYGSRVVIDAPQLHFLSIYGYLSESFTITNMDSNAKLDISLAFPSNGINIRGFLLGVSKVRDMTMCAKTIKLIKEYATIFGPLPLFGCVSRLCVTLCVFDLKWLPTFLESCPNLKSLILVMNPFECSSVPKCLLSCLEFVGFETSILGYTSEMELVRYFLVNSAILKKLTLRLHYNAIRQYDIFNKLLKIPKRCRACEVVPTLLQFI